MRATLPIRPPADAKDLKLAETTRSAVSRAGAKPRKRTTWATAPWFFSAIALILGAVIEGILAGRLIVQLMFLDGSIANAVLKAGGFFQGIVTSSTANTTSHGVFDRETVSAMVIYSGLTLVFVGAALTSSYFMRGLLRASTAMDGVGQRTRWMQRRSIRILVNQPQSGMSPVATVQYTALAIVRVAGNVSWFAVSLAILATATAWHVMRKAWNTLLPAFGSATGEASRVSRRGAVATASWWSGEASPRLQRSLDAFAATTGRAAGHAYLGWRSFQPHMQQAADGLAAASGRMVARAYRGSKRLPDVLQHASANFAVSLGRRAGAGYRRRDHAVPAVRQAAETLAVSLGRATGTAYRRLEQVLDAGRRTTERFAVSAGRMAGLVYRRWFARRSGMPQQAAADTEPHRPAEQHHAKDDARVRAALAWRRRKMMRRQYEDGLLSGRRGGDYVSSRRNDQ